MKPARLRIAFFGTPPYAVPALEGLAHDPRYEVALVVTQPDRPAGRGRALQSPPVRSAAQGLGIPVYQPDSLRSVDARAPLAAIAADLFVVAAYGLIFGRKTLGLPRHGCLNLHASLLPAYRGASPVTAAILSGDRSTGVSLMVMDAGLDTGSVVSQVEVPILSTDTTESLTGKLAASGATLIVESAVLFAQGQLAPKAQDASRATHARPLVRADGWLDWQLPAIHLDRRVRAMWPWPRAWTTVRGEPLQVHAATPLGDRTDLLAGVVDSGSGATIVGTGEGALRLDIVQTAGGKPLPGPVWARGRRVEDGEALGLVGAPTPPPALVTDVEANGI